MDEISQGLEVLRLFILPFMIGVVAAIIRACKRGWLGFWHHFREAILCGIYGALVSAIIDMYDLPPTAKYALTCFSAYAMVEVGDSIFVKLREIIQNLSVSDILPGWMGKKGGKKDGE